jgi:serine/threonine protein kinase
LKEKKAFERLLKDGRTPDHIIDFLGSYEQGDTRCILLEYADIGTLDDYFRTFAPPTSEKDIIQFFICLFDLLKGLYAVHQLEGSFVG